MGANHLLTLLLMVPPIIFFDLISSWDLGAVQLCILMVGEFAAPRLLYQPGRMTHLGVLCPDMVDTQYMVEVQGGGCVFMLGDIKEEQQPEEEEMRENNTTSETQLQLLGID